MDDAGSWWKLLCTLFFDNQEIHVVCGKCFIALWFIWVGSTWIRDTTFEIDHDLCDACQNGDLQLAKSLVERGAKVDHVQAETQWTPLIWASSAGNASLVTYLISNGARVNKPDGKRGITPLCWACFHGRIEVVQVLLERGADANIAANDGDTPAYIAAMREEDSILRLLYRYGANLTAENNDEYTPASIAAKEAHVSTLQTLVALGVDISGVDFTKALYTAAADDFPMALDALRKHGADIYHVRKTDAAMGESESVLEIALRKESPGVVRYLVHSGVAPPLSHWPESGIEWACGNDYILGWLDEVRVDAKACYTALFHGRATSSPLRQLVTFRGPESLALRAEICSCLLLESHVSRTIIRQLSMRK